MTTNGTLIKPKIQAFIEKNRIRLQISIDGDKITHDSNRYFATKEGCHDILMERTKELRGKNVLDARATITRTNFDITNIFKYLNNNGFNNIAISPAFNLLTDDEYDLLADEYIKMFEYSEKALKNNNLNNAKSNKIFTQEIARIHNARTRKVGCGVGRNMYTIDIDGNIYPCQRFVNHKEFVIGNVNNNDDGQKKFLNQISVDQFDKCNSCWVKNLCSGGCVHTNYTSTGAMNIPYDKYCEYTKKIKSELMKIYLRMTENDLKLLLAK